MNSRQSINSNNNDDHANMWQDSDTTHLDMMNKLDGMKCCDNNEAYL